MALGRLADQPDSVKASVLLQAAMQPVKGDERMHAKTQGERNGNVSHGEEYMKPGAVQW
eukprot:CAMPEP_0206593754 /NCGR_PEP_ID=MMETSP0325_2-20121206/41875_1 /ASSEMBLY_ACC=CAM_ASM_000347 /TAXON_ID=2866 /ORGANISM="Crypthecodinium cohnii, Strain Seligo" /LENGTH=58 /DNA_ID=CAMNT_0054103901 /DNA_START=235 /DNA_END=412 /DNA_ORIENTATION=+